jgi:hypothetical protein
MNDTFILLSRSILDSQVFANDKMLKVWVWCLCKANHKTRFASLKIGKGFTEVEVKRGQFIFGRSKAEEELFYDGSTIYKLMQKFERLEMIKIESNNQYSIITVCNYDTYQDATNYEVTTKEQPKNNQRTGKEQPSNTNKNVNNDKNEKKEIIYPFESSEFLLCWNKWKSYRKAEHGFNYKSDISEQTALTGLAAKSQNKEHRAIQIIEYSIAQGYKGLFDLKSYNPAPATKTPEVTENLFGTPAKR